MFDGDCAVCTRSAQWVERRWRAPAPRAVSSQRVNAEWPRLATPSSEEMDQSLWWIDGPRRYAGAAAVARALMATSLPWRLLGTALVVPPMSWIATPAYSLVARHRHRLPGASDACRGPA
ncbi:MAG: DUF393 domain-containing protein [Acidobacteria bacterium]|nr:DUF393 domain-containing protein [Acidobacteriota bacterium]